MQVTNSVLHMVQTKGRLGYGGGCLLDQIGVSSSLNVPSGSMQVTNSVLHMVQTKGRLGYGGGCLLDQLMVNKLGRKHHNFWFDEGCKQ